ncbi:T9SS type A sorting domain-containing protein [Flavobacterium johnsoniae]|uniref:T9SS type A sorting domain-containing protein n=1 Tax=Flavobacterium johnsoniae TaxID=986 RepID=UPI003D9954D8
MKKNDSQFSTKQKLRLLSFILILMSFNLNAQEILGLNPYCLASNPTYTVTAPANTVYDEVVWSCTDPAVTFTGNPSPLSLSKVVYKSPGFIATGDTLTAQFKNAGVVVAKRQLAFISPQMPVQPSYVVSKTNDYCTSQYHIIVLTVTPNPNPSSNTNFSITPTIADASIVITQTSKNVFELKLPLNGQPYFIYNITETTPISGCQSNTLSSTSYGNSVSLNLTGCANTTPNPGTNYDFTLSPNPYSNGNITITANAVSSQSAATCRIYDSSGVLKLSFSLTNSYTSIPLRNAIPSLTTGIYIFQITYANGTVKTKNLAVN